ncbi:hypothetical protein WICMUC_003030 [Wickerhamomyces mucosus]|uniref:Ankyrin repeat-containing protein YAR1 n=1 Tax=Wickerhamomyces mucosus TaxID=1378264 RepID=A0A9P8PMY1_9ASCO|nr:hypothetical protein WICMUC_003030 [Wickerhamomyces mucosus]
MSTQQLTQEEFDIILEDARYGDLETLQEIFSELPSSLLFEIKDEHTHTNAIHVASANGHLETVKYLLSLLAKQDAIKLVNIQNIEGNTPLHWAALNGHLQIVQLLCDEYEADAFVKNKFNHDSIFEAENNGKDDVETYFLKKFDVEPINADDDVEIKVSNDDVDVQVKPGTEIESISQEQVDNLQSNEEFINQRTKNLQI